MRPSLYSTILIALHVLLGLGAIGGGLVLMIRPDGALIQMPVTILEHSPFDSFLVPGIILFLTLGVLPLTVASGLIRKWSWKFGTRLNLFPDRHWSWTFSLYTGFILIGWIGIQLFFIRQVSMLHVIYILWGLAIQAITLLPAVQKYYAAGHVADA